MLLACISVPVPYSLHCNKPKRIVAHRTLEMDTLVRLAASGLAVSPLDGPPDSKRLRRTVSVPEDKWSVIWKDLPVGSGRGGWV